MKNEINLLSPQAQLERRQRLFRKRFSYIGRRLGLAILFLWAVMGGAIWWLSQEEKLIRREIALTADSTVSIQEQVRATNELMGVVARRVDEQPSWSVRLKDIVRLLPGEVRLEVFALTADRTLMVRGFSSSRTAVIDLERSLKQLSWVERVEAPLQNFAAGAKGEFSFTLIRKGDPNDKT